MPGRDGYDLIAAVRRLSRDGGGDVPALALSAYAGLGDRRRALDAGYDAHLGKPFEPMDLAALVHRLARRDAA